MKYTHKLNAFKPTTTWEVVEDGLVWTDSRGAAGAIPWTKIKNVRLRMEPSKAESRRIGLHVYTPKDHAITNIDYRGPLIFNVQREGFRDFVTAFHKGFPPTTKTIFHSGSTYAAYIGNILISLALFAFIFFLAPLLSLTGIPSAGSVVRIITIIILIPILLSMLIKNKPSTYDPRDIPMDMLK